VSKILSFEKQFPRELAELPPHPLLQLLIGLGVGLAESFLQWLQPFLVFFLGFFQSFIVVLLGYLCACWR
jgi:hypothetical protein